MMLQFTNNNNCTGDKRRISLLKNWHDSQRHTAQLPSRDTVQQGVPDV